MEADPSYEISIFREEDDPSITDPTLVGVIRNALRRHAVSSARINVALVSDARIARLNERHLQHSGPTDVLTFDLRDDATAAAGGSCEVEGELVISVETASRQAQQRGHGLEAEVALYAVHGALHLLGYDDKEEDEAAGMHRMEDEILVGAGLGAIFGSEDR